MNCLVCGNKMSELGVSGEYIINKCNLCGFGVTDGTGIQSGDYHRDKVYSREEALFKNIFQKRANIIGKSISVSSALEIGCSTGILLSLLKKRGWQVTGVEISKKAAELARSKNIEVIIQPFEKIAVNEKFDLVILNHTLEHLKEPIEVLKKIKMILKPKGYLYIDLPNFGGLSAKLMKVRWPLLLPEEHFWHFSEKSLILLLKSLGFKIIFKETASGIWDYENPIKGIFLSLVSFKKRFFGEVLTSIPSWIVTKLGLGSDLMVIARKA